MPLNAFSVGFVGIGVIDDSSKTLNALSELNANCCFLDFKAGPGLFAISENLFPTIVKPPDETSSCRVL
jgi:hypothetical protein